MHNLQYYILATNSPISLGRLVGDPEHPVLREQSCYRQVACGIAEARDNENRINPKRQRRGLGRDDDRGFRIIEIRGAGLRTAGCRPPHFYNYPEPNTSDIAIFIPALLSFGLGMFVRTWEKTRGARGDVVVLVAGPKAQGGVLQVPLQDHHVVETHPPRGT